MTGAALAGMSAAVGQKAIIFAPKSAPPAKVAMLPAERRALAAYLHFAADHKAV